MEHPTKEQVLVTRNKRIELLLAQGLDSSISGIILALISGVLLFLETQNLQYILWLALSIIVSGSRFILCKIFMAKEHPFSTYETWLKRYLLSSSISGVIWGSLLLIDLEPLSLLDQLLTFMLLAYVIFGMAATFSAIMKSISWSLISMLIIMTIGLLFIQDERFNRIAILFWITLPLGLSISKKFHHIIIHSLTHQLQVKKLNDKLELSNHDLEEKISQRTEDLVFAINEAAQAKQASSEFLANMTHELRTPLHAILSFSKLGTRQKIETNHEKKTEYFNKIHDSGERLLELTERLLELSKYDTGKPDFKFEKVNFVDIINKSILEFDRLIEEKSHTLIRSFTEQHIEVILDKVGIKKVISNLLSNAIKFSPEMSKITVQFDIRNMVLGSRATDTKTESVMMFSVIDEGIGIPDDEIKLIFDKFTQSTKTKTGAGGIGLGLAICKKVIDAHHGKIWAENNSGKGAKISFCLPLKEYTKSS